jgi:hypothetical protein
MKPISIGYGNLDARLIKKTDTLQLVSSTSNIYILAVYTNRQGKIIARLFHLAIDRIISLRFVFSAMSSEFDSRNVVEQNYIS